MNLTYEIGKKWNLTYEIGKKWNLTCETGILSLMIGQVKGMLIISKL
jgi:hypothetical protein